MSWSDIYKVGAATEAGAKVPAAPFGFDVRRAPGPIVGHGVNGWSADNGEQYGIVHPSLDFSQGTQATIQAIGSGSALLKSQSSTLNTGGLLRGDSSQVIGKVTSPVADGRNWTVFRIKSTDPDTDAGVKRANIRWAPVDPWINIGDEVWFAWQQYIPDTAAGLKSMLAGEACSFGGLLHDFGLGSGLGGTPAMRYTGAASAAARSRSYFISGSNDVPATDEFNQALWTQADYPVGVVETFVARHKLGWDASHEPISTLWRNGVQLATSTAPNAYRPDFGNPAQSHTGHFGLYFYNPMASGTREGFISTSITIVNQPGVTEAALRAFVQA
jgi:hypothetical protein